MLSRSGRRCASSALSQSNNKISIPFFLLPAFQASMPPSHTFSTSANHQSRIGSAPLSVPPEVTLTVTPPPPLPKNAANLRLKEPVGRVHVKGPLGEAEMEIPGYVTITKEAEGEMRVAIDDKKIRKHREMWGTTRSYLQNHITGVSEGHLCILRLVGVGYRASVESTATTVTPEYEGQKFVNLKVGYSHPVELGIPQGMKASTPQPTRLLLEGPNKHTVTQFAANIRKWRVPEPYKGKGIFINDETIELKKKKIK